MKQNNQFPWKKTITGSIIIVIVFAMSLTLASTIGEFAKEGDLFWIILLVWCICFVLALAIYWLLTYLTYRRICKRRNKNEKK